MGSMRCYREFVSTGVHGNESPTTPTLYARWGLGFYNREIRSSPPPGRLGGQDDLLRSIRFSGLLAAARGTVEKPLPVCYPSLAPRVSKVEIRDLCRAPCLHDGLQVAPWGGAAFRRFGPALLLVRASGELLPRRPMRDGIPRRSDPRGLSPVARSLGERNAKGSPRPVKSSFLGNCLGTPIGCASS